MRATPPQLRSIPQSQELPGVDSGYWQPSKRSRQSVLVVDDDPDVRTMLRQILEQDGYSVREASDGVEALAVLETEQIGVLITDLYMPRMDGFELLRRVRSGALVPRLVAMSGVVDFHTKPSESEAAVLLSTHAILDKPFTRRQLMSAVAEPEIL